MRMDMYVQYYVFYALFSQKNLCKPEAFTALVDGKQQLLSQHLV